MNMYADRNSNPEVLTGICIYSWKTLNLSIRKEVLASEKLITGRRNAAQQKSLPYLRVSQLREQERDMTPVGLSIPSSPCPWAGDHPDTGTPFRWVIATAGVLLINFITGGLSRIINVSDSTPPFGFLRDGQNASPERQQTSQAL